jgi:hypothetical protein
MVRFPPHADSSEDARTRASRCARRRDARPGISVRVHTAGPQRGMSRSPRGFPPGSRRGAAATHPERVCRRVEGLLVETTARNGVAVARSRRHASPLARPSVPRRVLGSGVFFPTPNRGFLTLAPSSPFANSRPKRPSRPRRSWGRSRSRTAPSPSGSACAPVTPSVTTPSVATGAAPSSASNGCV